MPVTAADLAAGGTTLCKAVCDTYDGDMNFDRLGKMYLDELLARDNEDGEKLQKGIDMAIAKDVLPAKVDVEKVTVVYGDGKSPDEVTAEVIAALGDAPSKGCVMTLQGLSGTGKGTTVDMLKAKLPKAQTWSNGNIFRSLTLLAKTYAEQNQCSIEESLTPALLKEFMGYLTFDKFGDSFDTKIEGLGIKHMVSEVQNTVLKTVGKDIPTVAEKTQGEVIGFIQDALQKMTADGMNVLLEGRTQTLNYIRTPHRFELKLKDMSVVGKRQGALIIGAAVKKLSPPEGGIKAALDKELLERLPASVISQTGSFSYKSNGLPISPGDTLSIPIATEEPSMLEMEWRSMDDQELEFSLIFTPSDGSEKQALVQSGRDSKLEGKFDVKGAGCCMLQWKNPNSGWFSGSPCTVSYTATLLSLKAAEDEQKRLHEAEMAQAREEEERLRADQRKKAEGEAQLRREDRESKLSQLRAESEASEASLAETHRSLARHDDEIAGLRIALANAEEARSAEQTMCSTLMQELDASREGIDKLVAEQESDDAALAKALKPELHEVLMEHLGTPDQSTSTVG